MAEHISAERFLLASCQATLFTPDKELSTRRLIANLGPAWMQRFDAEPFALPQTEGMPPEIPRLRLESQTKVWACQIAPIRIDIFWRRAIPDTPQISIGDFFPDVSSLLLEYQRVSESRVGRLAAVINRYTEHNSPGVFLSRHFCQERWIRSPLNRRSISNFTPTSGSHSELALWSILGFAIRPVNCPLPEPAPARSSWLNRT